MNNLRIMAPQPAPPLMAPAKNPSPSPPEAMKPIIPQIAATTIITINQVGIIQ